MVVVDAQGRWVMARPRVRDRLWARLRGGRLDADLAAGVAPESDARRAVRAGLLVAPATRAAVAGCWQDVLDRAERGPVFGDPRVPVLRRRVRAAAGDIAALVEALRVAGPVPSRGVALASRLLTDGGGPLYNVRDRRDLGALVREATGRLDPAADL